MIEDDAIETDIWMEEEAEYCDNFLDIQSELLS